MRTRLLVLGGLLAMLGLARLAGVVFHEPLAGYANNYDMIRVAACVGLYPDLPEPARYLATPAAPVPRYVEGATRPGSCRPTSALLFAYAGLLAAKSFPAADGAIDLRWIGAATWAFAAACVVLLAFLLRAHPVASLLHGATVFLVLGDPLVGLWFNSLYAEPATILGAYLMVGLLCAIALRGQAGIFVWTALCGAILLLGLSKHQFFALPLLLLVASLAALRHASARGTAVAFAAAALGIAAFFVPGNEGAYRANRVDTYLGAMAGASNDPSRTLAALGLPARCAPFIGTTYYRLRGESLDAQCPEVFALPAGAFVTLLRSEPRTVATAMARALAPSQAAYYGFVGVLAGHREATASMLAPWARSAWVPLFDWLRPSWYLELVVFMLAASLAAFAAAGWRAASPPGVLCSHVSMLAVVYVYAFVTAVLGDGAADAGKQVLLGSLALAAWVVALPFMVLASWRASAHLGVRATVLAAWIGALVFAAWTVTLYRAERLAFGVIDVPAGRSLAGGSVVTGWALDPVGVARVEATWDGRPIAARDSLPSPGPARVYPSLPRAATAGFEIALPGALLTPGMHELRVYVVNRRGVRTEVDRRRILTGSPPARG